MTPRMIWAPTVLLALALSATPAEAFFWPSRWTAKPKTPDPVTANAAPNPAAPPVVTWPPRARDLAPSTLPALPSSSAMLRPPTPPAPFPPAAKIPQPSPPVRANLAGAVELGRPTAVEDGTPATMMATLPAVMPTPRVSTNPTLPAPEPVEPYLPPGASLAVLPGEILPVSAEQRFDTPRHIVRGQIEDGAILPVQLSGPPPVPPPSGASVAPLPPLPEGQYNAGVELSRPLNKTFGDQCAEYLGFTTGGSSSGRSWFMSDHCFDEGIISPVTSPFLFEDPRSLTELRPLWVYTSIPKNSDLLGGNTNFLGVQARLAFTESISLVMNKIGGTWFNPEVPNFAGVVDGSGFAELNIGPKWTFWRSEGLGMVAAAGLTFQIPVGSASAFQNTGTLGLDPYMSYGWNFGRTSWGSFNYMTSAGYAIGVDDERSDYFHWHHHLSYDVANLHRIYPLVEFSWFKYTHRGHAQPFTFEGKDLYNFGSSNAGLHSYFTLAGGARFKLNEHIQTGVAAEWNLSNNKAAVDAFRLTLDLIFRY